MYVCMVLPGLAGVLLSALRIVGADIEYKNAWRLFKSLSAGS